MPTPSSRIRRPSPTRPPSRPRRRSRAGSSRSAQAPDFADDRAGAIGLWHEGALRHPPHRRAGVARRVDHRAGRVAAAEFLGHVPAVERARQPDVGEQHVHWLVASDEVQRLLARGRAQHDEAERLQLVDHELAEQRLVFDDEHRDRAQDHRRLKRGDCEAYPGTTRDGAGGSGPNLAAPGRNVVTFAHPEFVVMNWIPPRLLRILAIVSAFGVGGPSQAQNETEVDLALVLAVDVSRSMDDDEQRLQRDGFVEAFRSAVVHDAIHRGVLGRIAVVYMEWSGPTEQKVVLPWTVIDGPERALAFSARLAQAPIGRIFSTSISGAIDYGLRLLGESGVDPFRRVIDVSGDGPNNTGRMVTLARDEAVRQGVTINGLAFMLKRPTGYGDIENLDLYYQDCVIGGPGAFIVPVREARHFAEAVRIKLVREIAGVFEPEPLIKPAQERERMNCLIGEIMRRQRFEP